MHACMCMCIYIYIYIEVWLVVSDKLAHLSATPYKRDILLRRRRRLLLLLLLLLLLMIMIIIIIMIIGDARGRRQTKNAKVAANPENRDRVRPSVGRPSVRGARSIARCVARRSNVVVRSLCGAIDRSVRGPIAVSDRSNVALRDLCGDFCQNSSEPRCARSLRPIAFSTLVSYRAGRCLRT